MAYPASEILSSTPECVLVPIPKDLLADVDMLVGQQDRNDFLVNVLRKEVKRRCLLQFLSNPEPLLKDEDYPEFRKGSEDFVRNLRQQDEQRDKRIFSDWLPRPE